MAFEVQVSVALDAETKERLELMAKDQGRSISGQVRYLVSRAVGDYVASRALALGDAARDGP